MGTIVAPGSRLGVRSGTQRGQAAGAQGCHRRREPQQRGLKGGQETVETEARGTPLLSLISDPSIARAAHCSPLHSETQLPDPGTCLEGVEGGHTVLGPR